MWGRIHHHSRVWTIPVQQRLEVFLVDQLKEEIIFEEKKSESNKFIQSKENMMVCLCNRVCIKPHYVKYIPTSSQLRRHNTLLVVKIFDEKRDRSYMSNQLLAKMQQNIIFFPYLFSFSGFWLDYMVIRIAKSSEQLPPFNIYVALLKSRGRKRVRILREFDPTLFIQLWASKVP